MKNCEMSTIFFVYRRTYVGSSTKMRALTCTRREKVPPMKAGRRSMLFYDVSAPDSDSAQKFSDQPSTITFPVTIHHHHSHGELSTANRSCCRLARVGICQCTTTDTR